LALSTLATGGFASAQEPRTVPPETLKAILSGPLLDPATGPASADVILIEYFDYNCPVCRHLEPQLRRLAADDPKVRIVRKDWPVFGDASAYAAFCSFAAAHMGKYASAHDALIGTSKDLDSRDDVRQVLRDAGFDLTQLDTDIARHKTEYDAALQRDQREAQQLGLRGTPGVVVGNQIVPGGMDYAQLVRFVARARQARVSAALPGEIGRR
jgi:protein-disulfide isomerase